jgi:hypothetical protein
MTTATFNRKENMKTPWSRDAPQDTDKLGYKPTSKDFASQAVAKAVLVETVQHPATSLPLAGSVVALGWTLIIAATPLSVCAALGLAFVGASAWAVNCISRGPQFAAAHVKKLHAMRRQYDRNVVQELGTECARAGFDDGAKEAKDIITAYDRLVGHLENLGKQGSLGHTYDRFYSLAEDTFKQGSSVLTQALTVFQAVQAVDIHGLEKELKTWNRQRQKFAEDGIAEQDGPLQQRIEEHKRRIALHRQRQQSLDDLLAQANAIEGALESTYLELVEPAQDSTLDFLSQEGSAAKRLLSAVEDAQRAEEKLQQDLGGHFRAKTTA